MPAGLLSSPSSSSRLGLSAPCFGGRCGGVLQKSCPGLSGRILGGQVQQGRDVTQIRLWLHDLASGQTAFQDDYCQSCELIGAVATQAARLLGSPPAFGAPPTAAPAYCSLGATARPPASAASGVAAGPLFLAVVGDHKHRAAVQAAVKQQLALLGKPVQVVEVKSLGLEVLQKLVAAHPRSQLLGIELPKDGKVQVILYDQASAQNDGKLIECENCDKDTLLSRLKTEVPPLLDHCFGDSCGNPSAPPTGSAATAAEAPPAACQPFADAACGVTESGTPNFPARHIDPKTAKLLKGLTWGTFAATTASSLALFAADASGAGASTDLTGIQVRRNLLAPAATLALVGGVLLVVAIPSTIVIQKATIQRSDQHDATNRSSEIQCPAQ